MFNKFYCKECNRIKSRFQVKGVEGWSNYEYYCKWCHNEVETLDHMLIRMNDAINKNELLTQLYDLKDWVRREAIERYPKSGAEKKAFKEGVYALLDKIGFVYLTEEE